MALKSDGLHDLFFAKLDDVETLFGPGRLKTFRLEGIVLLKLGESSISRRTSRFSSLLILCKSLKRWEKAVVMRYEGSGSNGGSPGDYCLCLIS